MTPWRTWSGRIKLGAILAVAMLAMGSWWLGAQAGADPACDGRRPYPCRGYFYDRLPPNDEDLIYDMYDPEGLGLFADDINELVNMIRTRLECSGGTMPQSKQNPTSAAFTVLVMLGAPDRTTKNTACARFAEWESLVRQYDARGLIQYDVMYDYSRNSAYDSTNFDAIRHPEDDVDNSIVIYSESGSVLIAIERICGNMLDELNALPPLVPPTGTINPPTNTPPNPPGTTPGNPNVNSTCTLISGTASDPKDPGFAVRVSINYVMGGSNIGSDQVFASTSGSRAYQTATPAAVQNSLSPVTVTATGRDSTGTDYPIGSITIGPCLQPDPSCEPMQSSPSAIEPSTPFTINTKVKYGSLAAATAVRNQAGFSYFMTITGPAGYSYTNNNVAASQPDGQFAISGSATPPASNAAGIYNVGWGVRGPFGAINCGAAIPGNGNPPFFRISSRPFFNVSAGDVSAGGGMDLNGAQCTQAGGRAPNNKGSVVSWNRNDAGVYGGAGTQQAAFAMNRLQGFVTGQGSAAAPGGVSFANTGGAADPYVPSNGQYGGQFGNLPCVPDFLDGATDPSAAGQRLSAILGIASGGTYFVGDGVTPARRTVYVPNGNILVDVNVQLTAAGNYANAASIPFFSLLVRGNIYIEPSISRLDGVYIAQPSNGTATNGIIYTCAPDGFGTTAVNILTRDLYDRCDDRQLTFNGAVAARQVWLLRTFGSLNSNVPAESINYSPELWISPPSGGGGNRSSIDIYDAITGLPPTL